MQRSSLRREILKRSEDLKIDSVEMMVTERCNLNCKYCFHRKRPYDMNMEVVERSIDFLKDKLSKKPLFIFWGGEPLLAEGFIISSVKYIRSRISDSQFFLSSNGTIYSEKVVDLIKNGYMNGGIQISYDGLSQDENRGMSSVVRENIKRYIGSVGSKNVHVSFTFTDKTVCNLAENLKDIYSLGVRSAKHGAVFELEWSDHSLREYSKQLDLMYDFVKKNTDIRVAFADCKAAISGRGAGKGVCALGKNFITVDHDGSIFPCHRAVNHQEFKIGNVFDGVLNRGRFMSMGISKCKNCDASAFCHNCVIASYEAGKRLCDPLDSVCYINKQEHKKALSEYIETYGGTSENERNIIMLSVNVCAEIKNTLYEISRLLKGEQYVR